MTCLKCNSIWLRPAELQWRSGASEGQWARKFACGSCGALFDVQLTHIGQVPTDRAKHETKMNPPPKVMLENGGTHK